MSKTRENVAILVKGIIGKDRDMIHVKDGALIPYYLHNSRYMFEIEEDNNKWSLFISSHERYRGHREDFNELKEYQLNLAQELGANYIFASPLYCGNKLVSIVTPFAILSGKETDFLVKNFYKDVPENVSKAAEELEIVLYDKLYSHYMQGNITKIGEVLDYKGSWEKSFFNFIFNLPYEEQNIEFNKKILRTFSSGYDLIRIMTKEYSEGKHFQEYFENVSHHYEGKKVVEAIKNLERKPDHDVYLLKKGFVLGEDSAINLYRQDAQAFINYFQKLGVESQKFMIEKIYEDSFVNQEVVDWLEKSYADLLREVGFSGGKPNGSNRI